MATNFDLGKENAMLRQQQTNYPDIIPYYLFEFFENIGVEEGVSLIETRDVSGDGAWGKGFANSTHTANDLYWGSAGAVWQSTYTNAKVLAYVINPNNTFKEHFIDNQFIDTGASTVALTFGASGTIAFDNAEILQSTTCHKDGTTITSATLYVNTSLVSGNLTYYLSANGGTNFEAVTVNTPHTFTNTGTALKYKIVSSGASSIDIAYVTNNKILEVKVN